jgi:hypothetical protein
MADSERFKLLYGPYVAPKCAVGDKLPCEYRGRGNIARLLGRTEEAIRVRRKKSKIPAYR